MTTVPQWWIMKVLVTGGRDFNDRNLLNFALSVLHAATPFTLLIHGNARGADSLADEWARGQGIDTEVYPADWKKHGKPAGIIRNQQMLDQHPDLVVAFPGGKGTKHMTDISRKAGIKTILLTPPR